MHVVMLAERLHPHRGGVEAHVAGLARCLVARGHQVTLFAPSHDPSLPDREQEPGCVTWRMPRGRGARLDHLRTWRWWAGHQDILRTADVVHCHEDRPLVYWYLPWRLARSGLPVALTFHGCDMRHPPSRRAVLLKRAAGWLAPRSLAIGHYLISWYGLQPRLVSYGAVTPPPAPPPPGEADLAVFCGRLAADTGLDLYLRGLGCLRRDYGLALRLLVCGDGPSRPALEALARQEGVAARFAGTVPAAGPALLQGGIALASGYLAILEAMALRRPVFAVYHNPVKESYLRQMPGAAGALSIAGSPAELAAQLAAHLSDTAGAAAVVARAAALAATWTWDRLADDYLALWAS